MTDSERTAAEGRPQARQPAVTDALVVLGWLVLLGAVCGVLWWLLVDPAEYTSLGGRGEMGELELGKRFGADGWYVVLAFVAALPSGVALTWWRSRDPLLVAGLLLVGSALAAVVMALVGHALGPGNADAALRAVRAGGHVPVPLQVTAKTAYLAWPIGALLGSLLVLWSKPLEPEV